MSAPLDTVYTAETPEGIALELRPAGLVARGYALAIDGAIRFAIIIAAVSVLAATARFGAGILLILFFLLEWFYPVLFELLPGAATPGKRAMGLRVVMDSGLPVTPAASLVRNLLRAADFLPVLYGLGGLMLLLRPDFKRLGDLAAGTLVVHANAAKLHGPLGAAEPLAPPRALSTREQAAVIAWAGRATRLTEARLGELALLAGPIVATPGEREPNPDRATKRLLGVAQWLVGRR
ncbi:MAG: RDD family protein [Burkholderiales bacterium]